MKERRVYRVRALKGAQIITDGVTVGAAQGAGRRKPVCSVVAKSISGLHSELRLIPTPGEHSVSGYLSHGTLAA